MKNKETIMGNHILPTLNLFIHHHSLFYHQKLCHITFIYRRPSLISMCCVLQYMAFFVGHFAIN